MSERADVQPVSAEGLRNHHGEENLGFGDGPVLEPTIAFRVVGTFSQAGGQVDGDVEHLVVGQWSHRNAE